MGTFLRALLDPLTGLMLVLLVWGAVWAMYRRGWLGRWGWVPEGAGGTEGGRVMRGVRWVPLGVFVLLWITGLAGPANLVVRYLEAPYEAAEPHPEAGVSWIVVLAAGDTWDPRWPTGAWLGPTSLARLLEGVRLQKALPEAQLIVMGATQPMPGYVGAPDPEPTYPAVAELMGADMERLLFVQGAPTTRAEAQLAAELIPSGAEVFVVTSAPHLRRSEYLFERVGLDPIPAPSNAHTNSPEAATRGGGALRLGHFVPSSRNQEQLRQGVHEVVGLWVARLRGR